MRYEIRGTILQTVDVTVSPGESVYTETGGMAWMTPNMQMNSTMKGGLMGALGRMVSGESLFLVDYTPQGGDGMVTFANSFPGKILDFTLAEGQSLVCQKESFLAAQSTVTLATFFQRKLGAGLFGGEGFFLQKLTGPGLVFAELSGEITEYTLEPDHRLLVSPGHVALFEPTVTFEISMVKGIRNILFSGEGLFLADLRGPGKVWLQSMPLPNLASRLIPYLPKKNS
jgi:uncharacterized protein (TIGR00266 family)